MVSPVSKVSHNRIRKAPDVQSAEPVNVLRWGVVWRSRNSQSETCYVIHDYARTLTFNTKKDADAFIRKTFGYIPKRQDLKRDPHGWFIPKAVRVNVYVEVA